jgi:hypothetical protein
MQHLICTTWYFAVQPIPHPHHTSWLQQPLLIRTNYSVPFTKLWPNLTTCDYPLNGHVPFMQPNHLPPPHSMMQVTHSFIVLGFQWRLLFQRITVFWACIQHPKGSFMSYEVTGRKECCVYRKVNRKFGKSQLRKVKEETQLVPADTSDTFLPPNYSQHPPNPQSLSQRKLMQ